MLICGMKLLFMTVAVWWLSALGVQTIFCRLRGRRSRVTGVITRICLIDILSIYKSPITSGDELKIPSSMYIVYNIPVLCHILFKSQFKERINGNYRVFNAEHIMQLSVF